MTIPWVKEFPTKVGNNIGGTSERAKTLDIREENRPLQNPQIINKQLSAVNTLLSFFLQFNESPIS